MRNARRFCARLGIEGLSEKLAGLRATGAYVVYASSPQARDTLAFDTARNSHARHTTLARAGDPDKVAADCRRFLEGASDHASPHGVPSSFDVLVAPVAGLAAGVLEPLPVHASSPLAWLAGGLRALAEYRSPSGGLFVLEDVDHWFDWDDLIALRQQMDHVVQWSRAWRCCVLLVLGGHGRSSVGWEGETAQTWTPGFVRPDPEATLDGAAHVLRAGGDGLVWRMVHWNEGRKAAAERLLSWTGGGSLRALDEAPPARDTLANRVLATQDAVGEEERSFLNLDLYPDNAALAQACEAGPGVVALFSYTGPGDLEPLCRAVFDVRHRCGRDLGIMVRERRGALRYQHELLLRSLGANIVVGRVLSFPRFQILLEGVRRQRYAGVMARDYQTALAAASAGSSRGYLSLPRFCEHVQGVMEGNRFLRLPHVLVKLPLRAQSGHLSALRACHLMRSGDLFTADVDCLYVFLFSCPASEVDRVLDHTFGSELLVLFEHAISFRDVEEQVERMLLKARTHVPVDYGDVLSEDLPAPPSESVPTGAPDSPDPFGGIDEGIAEGSTGVEAPSMAEPAPVDTARRAELTEMPQVRSGVAP